MAEKKTNEVAESDLKAAAFSRRGGRAMQSPYFDPAYGYDPAPDKTPKDYLRHVQRLRSERGQLQAALTDCPGPERMPPGARAILERCEQAIREHESDTI